MFDKRARALLHFRMRLLRCLQLALGDGVRVAALLANRERWRLMPCCVEEKPVGLQKTAQERIIVDVVCKWRDSPLRLATAPLNYLFSPSAEGDLSV